MRTSSLIPRFFLPTTPSRTPCNRSPSPRMPLGHTTAPLRRLTPIPRLSGHSSRQTLLAPLSAWSQRVVSRWWRCALAGAGEEGLGTAFGPDLLSWRLLREYRRGLNMVSGEARRNAERRNPTPQETHVSAHKGGRRCRHNDPRFRVVPWWSVCGALWGELATWRRASAPTVHPRCIGVLGRSR